MSNNVEQRLTRIDNVELVDPGSKILEVCLWKKVELMFGGDQLAHTICISYKLRS